MFSKILKNKLGQTGETVTWIVATVIIVVILFVSIFITSVYLGDGKEFSFTRQADSLVSKSFFSYLLTKNNEGKTIYEQLKNEKLDEDTKLNENIKSLAEKVFDHYRKDYGIFVRLTNKVGDQWIEIIEPKTIIPKRTWPHIISDRIKLDEEKYAQVILSEKEKFD